VYPTSLVFGLLDTSERLKDAGLAAKLRRFTIGWSRYDYQGPLLEDTTVNGILDRALVSGYRWCLLQAYGHLFTENWDPKHWGRTNVAAALLRLLRDSGFLVYGPITGDETQGYGLDDQCLLVNLTTYAALGQPSFSDAGRHSVGLIVPSVWREGDNSQGRLEALLPTVSVGRRVPCLPGWDFIDASLRARKPVRAFASDLEQYRRYLAPLSGGNQISSIVGHNGSINGRSGFKILQRKKS
jgi:hypothetical protein